MKDFLKNIGEKEFDLSNLTTVFGKTETSRRFGIISVENSQFKIAWDSDMIVPEVLEINNVTITVGIDQNFSIIDTKKEKILLYFKLDSFFYKAVIIKDYLLVCAELEIVKIDVVTCEVLENIFLEEYFKSLTIDDNDKITITSVDGSYIELL